MNEYERVKFFNDISALLCDNDENVETIIGGDYNLRISGEEEILMLGNFRGRGGERNQE